LTQGRSKGCGVGSVSKARVRMWDAEIRRYEWSIRELMSITIRIEAVGV
jgi:hypothetical protein